ncbi:hypothetical protein TSUD_371220 [Trifolium subterraneum]|uniref:Uncharacterized protein n=1 Tax=Trifolium subterraneum TaxID=3900 RepID=A0A2Z6PEX1_TRISU|nr:hypothetical protein TSUD_371220 [Trifolium subterraneum]
MRKLSGGIRHSQRRGQCDPPKPSQSCTSPTAPPPPHMSISPGVKHDQSKRESRGLTEADEYYADNDSEDEGIQVIRKRKYQQQSLRQETTSMSSSRGSHDRRKVISVEVVSNPRRFVPQTVTRDIMSRVITSMPTPAEKWKDYSIETKDELFKDFMASIYLLEGKYKFPSNYDRNMARTVWEKTCMDRYPDHLKNARKVALREVNSTDLVDTKGHGPKGMKAEVWDGLVDIWLKPEWKKKSDANRCNRASLPNAVLHTGGSINFGEHKKRMVRLHITISPLFSIFPYLKLIIEEELKHEVSYRDVYDRVHKKKSGEYISQRSRTYIESYDTAMLEKYGQDLSTHPIVDSKVWTKSFGYKKARQTFVRRSLDLDGSVSASSAEANRIVTSEEFIKNTVDRAMTSFVQLQLTPMLEPIISMIQTMHKAPMQC